MKHVSFSAIIQFLFSCAPKCPVSYLWVYAYLRLVITDIDIMQWKCDLKKKGQTRRKEKEVKKGTHRTEDVRRKLGIITLGTWSWALLQELWVAQLGKKFPALYAIQKFITVFTTARHLYLYWVRWIQLTCSFHSFLWSTLISPFLQCLGISTFLFPWKFFPHGNYVGGSYRKSWATFFCMRTGNSRRRRVRW